MNSKDLFKGKRFGLFIHWGLYAIPGWHEQILWRWNLPREEYEGLIHVFNPSRFDPGQWIDIARNTGMEYICFTVKHHDGFCMWDTKQTGYNIMNTPYGKDVFRILSEECKRNDFPLGIYYSCVDWYHPCYPNMGRSHELLAPRDTDTPDIDRYYDYVSRQMRELCTDYGNLYQLFWDLNIAEYRNPKINEDIKRMQPDILINDRGPSPGDYRTCERILPEYNPSYEAMEACQSIGSSSWGYRYDEDYFTVKYFMKSIDRILSMGGNYILNVGPDADGNFSKKAHKILNGIGSWFNKVKESYYGKRSILFQDYSEYYLTYDKNLLYVHIHTDLDKSSVVLDFVNRYPLEVILLNTNEHLDYVVDVLPYSTNGKPCLRIRDIPADELTNELLVIKIEFDCDVTFLNRVKKER